MGIPQYLAMTGAELRQNPPENHTAWMSCHFSPYGQGLSNFPGELPENALLILDDSTPIEHHDPQLIAQQLGPLLEGCAGVLLDFQRPGYDQAEELAGYLMEALPCPVGVSHLYAKALNCPVFLPPGELTTPLEAHLAPWKGRDIWLEMALTSEVLTLTEGGCTASPATEIPQSGFLEEKLHCRYAMQTGEDYARFTLWRTREDLKKLLAEAEGLGVTLGVGLWQELHG